MPHNAGFGFLDMTYWNEVLTELGPENQSWRYAASSHSTDPLKSPTIALFWP
jgi:hypothetical protein